MHEIPSELATRLPDVDTRPRGAGPLPVAATQAGRYHLHEEIARGGMGAIYRAYDPDMHRSLAVKVLLPEHQSQPDLERRFLDEAQLAGQLQHPGIAPVHEIGRPFFAMKLIKGRTLADLLKVVAPLGNTVS